MTAMKITAELLREQGAFYTDVGRFRKEWPYGVELSEVFLLRAAELGLDLEWFARHVLSNPSWKEYYSQEAPLWKKHECQKALLREELERKKARLIWELFQADNQEEVHGE